MIRGLTFAAGGQLAVATWGDDEADSQDFSACPSTQRAFPQLGVLGFVGGKTTDLTKA